jgi:hypothetical protein
MGGSCGLGELALLAFDVKGWILMPISGSLNKV